jgi:hypothetical protein
MKQLPKALDRNGDLWVPCATKHLLFRALQDARAALESTHGLEVTRDRVTTAIDHGEQLRGLALVESLLGMDGVSRALPPVHDQLGEPSPVQARLLLNLKKMRPL